MNTSFLLKRVQLAFQPNRLLLQIFPAALQCELRKLLKVIAKFFGTLTAAQVDKVIAKVGTA